jgi:lipopolysaccharide export system protein LptC
MDRRQRRLMWVRFLRRTLPVVAGVVLAGVVGQVAWRALVTVAAPTPVVSESSVRMVNPTFSGQGRDGSRYLVTAQSGVRDPKDPVRILLQRPTVSVTRNGEPGPRTVSDRGVFREDDLSLKLEGDVRVADGSGYRFVTNDAVIDTGTGQVAGTGGIQGKGPVGDVSSDSYAVSEKGDRMVFKGGVRARIDGR